MARRWRSSCASRKATPAGVSGASKSPATRSEVPVAPVTATVKTLAPAPASKAEAGDGVGRAHQALLDLPEVRELEVLEQEVRRPRREVVPGDGAPVHPHLGVRVAGLLALPEAAALEGDDAQVGASHEIHAEARVAEGEAVAQQRRRVRHGVRYRRYRPRRAEQAEAPLRRVRRGLEDARGLCHHLLAGAPEVEGEAPRRRQRRHLHELDAIDVQRALAAIDEGEPGDVGRVDGALDLAAVRPVLFSSPEAAREVELDDVIARRRPEAVLVAIVEARVAVLDLEAQPEGAPAGVVHGEAQRAVAGPVGHGEYGERAHHDRVEPERARADGAPVGGEGRRARARSWASA